VQIVSEPLPRVDLRDSKTRCTVRKRRKEQEAPKHQREDNTRSDPATHLAGRSNALPHRARKSPAMTLNSRRAFRILGLNAEDELDKRTRNETRRQMRRQVVVQEELTTHDVKGNVMRSPSEEEETSRVVETGTCAYTEKC
jgi:hypothetical protein